MQHKRAPRNPRKNQSLLNKGLWTNLTWQRLQVAIVLSALSDSVDLFSLYLLGIFDGSTVFGTRVLILPKIVKKQEEKKGQWK